MIAHNESSSRSLAFGEYQAGALLDSPFPDRSPGQIAGPKL
jgi:hypothetical protein